MTTMFGGPRRRVVQRLDPVPTDTKYHWMIDNVGAFPGQSWTSTIRHRYVPNGCMTTLPSLILKVEPCGGPSQVFTLRPVSGSGGMAYSISQGSLRLTVDGRSTASDARILMAPADPFSQFHQELYLPAAG